LNKVKIIYRYLELQEYFSEDEVEIGGLHEKFKICDQR
jgi:hypothetical protein